MGLFPLHACVSVCKRVYVRAFVYFMKASKAGVSTHLFDLSCFGIRVKVLFL